MEIIGPVQLITHSLEFLLSKCWSDICSFSFILLGIGLKDLIPNFLIHKINKAELIYIWQSHLVGRKMGIYNWVFIIWHILMFRKPSHSKSVFLDIGNVNLRDFKGFQAKESAIKKIITIEPLIKTQNSDDRKLTLVM